MTKKRISMKGMGADAFFNPPTQQEEEEDITPPAQKETSLPVEKPTSTPVEKNTSLPVQSTTSTPAQKETSTEYIKASYYITVEQDLKLEGIRLERRKRGEKIDKSALIREAIDKL